MPQLHLPMFPNGVTHITDQLAFMKQDGHITYFNGHMPVFAHAETDIASFRMITSQFCVSGYVKECEIVRACGVTSISVKRSVKTFREKGPKAFYAPRATRGAAVLVEDVLAKAEELPCGWCQHIGGCQQARREAQHPAKGDPCGKDPLIR